MTFDGNGGRGEFDVCIAVMNIDEEGKITLRDEDGNELVQPYALGPITADLTDPDGGVTGIVWVWSRAQIDPPGIGDDARSPIADATSATYTPTTPTRATSCTWRRPTWTRRTMFRATRMPARRK